MISNRNFISLINPTPSKCDELDISDVLLGGEWFINGQTYKEQGHIFDYNFADDTTIDEKTFVFVETDINTVRENMFMDFNLFVCVFSHKSLVRIRDDSFPSLKAVKDMGYFTSNYANRIDVLCDIIDRTLNGNNKIPGIGNLEPATRGFMTIYCPNNKYYGKCLKYHISNLNEVEESCGN